MKQITIDGNTAAAKMAYYLNEVSSIYPITPSSTMAEYCDQWASEGKTNIFGQKMLINELQSEAGVAGAVHGSLSAGSVTTTFTASQGLLLMIPNMYKIAGECLPCVFHVSARALATHALSIFGDHSDVMACLGTGFNMICSTSVQEALDMSLASQLIALKSSLPFVHFFDGFRTSHEIQKIYDIDEEDIKKIFPYDAVRKFKQRALNPEHPVQKGTAQNPDVYFQNRERINEYYNRVYDYAVETFADVEKITGRHYAPFEYYGHKDAEYVVVMMGSAVNTVRDTIEALNKQGKKYGLVNVRLYRPFNTVEFCKTLPKTAKHVAVLDRTKNSGAIGEQLYQDVISALFESNTRPNVVGGRYGLGSKEFTPAHVKAIYDNLESECPKNHFTVGIDDDITHSSLEVSDYTLEDNCYELKFFGLGSDGTVSANKNSIKIIGESTDKYVQGYFEYDSKKSGSMTISHLRTSDTPILKPYTVTNADFIAVHNFSFVSRYDLLDGLKNNGIVLLNTVLDADALPQYLPNKFIDTLKQKNAKFYIINAQKIAEQVGLGNKINVIMQTAYFKLTQNIPYEVAKEKMEKAIVKSYSSKGEKIVASNIEAIKLAEDCVVEVDYSNFVSTFVTDNTKTGNEFFDNVINPIEKRKGDKLPVSAFSVDGAIPTDTAKYLKRGIAANVPQWIAEHCVQCGQCTLSCPHAAIRSVVTSDENLADKPEGMEVKKALGVPGCSYRIQISPLDCTGCGICAKTCPALKKALEMKPLLETAEQEQKYYEYCEKLPQAKTPFAPTTTKGIQFKKPYFEFNFACAGCGETPYIKIASQLFGDRMIVANATGCSSIYGGSYPACPYAKDKDGHGPAWANSLFEDNAEFGLGICYAEKNKTDTLLNLLENFVPENQDLAKMLEDWKQTKTCTYEQKQQIQTLLETETNPVSKQIAEYADTFVQKSIWVIGGDGWAYDIGYGGLDHLLSSNENINVLVLDSEVYSNTGGQSSKSTPKGSSAKFAAKGKTTKKKDLAQIAMANHNAYVASISLGADYNQAIKAFAEAEKFDGPSLIIAYSPCVNHGLDMSKSQEHQKLAVECGYWNLFRFNPRNEQPLTIDSKEPIKDYMEFLNSESRYTSIKKKFPETAETLFEESKQEAITRRKNLEKFLNKD